ncbi:Smr/MutS family protein [Desulfobotulus sp. H1]|uniref:Smr/MutS family protein n=1 Tax=Desulfobotulus pelophilus TaxID=2823377 RepID=A0ABT3N5F2_9BACT|nr:Smr/MutS family protein [Desulfobotulus pelophilus]MCW7752695.1 Smr/MutS family protein [Desulfobotulus pelophilus]
MKISLWQRIVQVICFWKKEGISSQPAGKIRKKRARRKKQRKSSLEKKKPASLSSVCEDGSLREERSFSEQKKPDIPAGPEPVDLPLKTREKKKKFRRHSISEVRGEKKEKIPLLDEDADLFVLMGGDPVKEGPVQEPDLPEQEILGDIQQQETVLLWPPAERMLDLHGMTTAQAAVRMRSAILSARMEGIAVLRIVTGKGLHSKGGNAVLREYAEEFLSQMQRNGEIRMFRWEGRTRSKSGAVLVRLSGMGLD